MPTYKISHIKVQPPRQVAFFEGLRTDLELGHQLDLDGRPVTIVAIGHHNRTTIGTIHPAALKLASTEVTSVAYYEE